MDRVIQYECPNHGDLRHLEQRLATFFESPGLHEGLIRSVLDYVSGFFYVRVEGLKDLVNGLVTGLGEFCPVGGS